MDSNTRSFPSVSSHIPKPHANHGTFGNIGNGDCSNMTPTHTFFPCYNSPSPGLILPDQIIDPVTGLVTCAPHFYCPHLDPRNSSTFPNVCLPSSCCAQMRSFGKLCEEAQGYYEPMLCNRMYYCPKGGKEKIPCPKGHYCPDGAMEPIKCGFLTYCGYNSFRTYFYGSAIILMLLYLFLIASVIFYRKKLVFAPKLKPYFAVDELFEKSSCASTMAVQIFTEAGGTAIPTVRDVGDAADEKETQTVTTSTDGKVSKCIELHGTNNSELVDSLINTLEEEVKGDTGNIFLDKCVASPHKTDEEAVTAAVHRNHFADIRSSNPFVNDPFDANVFPDEIILVTKAYQNAREDSRPLTISFNNLLVKIPVTEACEAHNMIAKQQKVTVQLPKALPLTRRIMKRFSIDINTQYFDVISGITGSFFPMTVTAIMGPSGSGKTTFLNVLLGRLPDSWKVEGTISINGDDRPSISRMYRKMMGFVPQRDVLNRELTVYQNFYYSAHLRLPSSWSSISKEYFIDGMLKLLQLKSARNVIIGDEEVRGVSGGQCRRASIGMELVAAPTVLFLDEPTNGLDASTANHICQNLKQIAVDAKLTIAMIIHQPRVEIWKALDNVLFFSPKGRTVYQGPQKEAELFFRNYYGVLFFERCNPADVIIDEITVHGHEFADKWERLMEKGESVYRKKHLANAGAKGDEIAKGVAVRLEVIQFLLDRARKGDTMEEVLAGSDDEEEDQVNNDGRNTTQLNGGQDVNRVEKHNHIHFLNVHHDHHPEDKQRDVHHSHWMGSFLFFKGKAPIHQYSHHISSYHAGFFKQFVIFFKRTYSKQFSDMRLFYVEIIVLLLLGSVIGLSMIKIYLAGSYRHYKLISPTSVTVQYLPQILMYDNMALGSVASMVGVNIFINDRQIYFREAGTSCIYRSAYFLSVITAAIPRYMLHAFLWTTCYHLLPGLDVSFGHLYFCFFLIFWVAASIGSCTVMVLPAEIASLVSTVISLIFSCFNGFIRYPMWMQYLSFAFWSSNILQHEIWASTDTIYENRYNEWGWEFNPIVKSASILIFMGIVGYSISYYLMITINSSKQR